MVRKTRLNRGKPAKSIVHKVVASYNAKFGTASAAKAAQSNIKSNPKADVGPIKKIGKNYGFTVKFAFITPSISVRNKAIEGAKKAGARVNISKIKM